MRIKLAEKLLITIMDWTSSEVSAERPLLQALSNFKYNEYQHFTVGTLYIESLAKWLSNFSTIEERKIAYDFVKSQLIFISNNQILHLVNITFDTIIRPILISKIATSLNLEEYETSKIITDPLYDETLRRSLYIGLSDGAKIDRLRRSCSMNNEQVIPTYEINKEKASDMLTELQAEYPDKKFNTIFLVDDFSASGTSYFRKEDNDWKGKIHKTIRSFVENGKALSELVDINEKLDIHLIFYICSTEAEEKIKKNAKEAICELELSHILNFKIHIVQEIDSSIKENILNNHSDFIDLSKKIIDKSIVDRHWEKAKHEKYYLGYGECSLPIILSHNTPNNSLPLLWWNDKKGFYPIFPRITRHN